MNIWRPEDFTEETFCDPDTNLRSYEITYPILHVVIANPPRVKPDVERVWSYIRAMLIDAVRRGFVELTDEEVKEELHEVRDTSELLATSKGHADAFTPSSVLLFLSPVITSQMALFSTLWKAKGTGRIGNPETNPRLLTSNGAVASVTRITGSHSWSIDAGYTIPPNEAICYDLGPATIDSLNRVWDEDHPTWWKRLMKRIKRSLPWCRFP